MEKERLQILNMLAEGKLTVDEAERLLSALDEAKEDEKIEAENIDYSEVGGPGEPVEGSTAVRNRKKVRFLRVDVDSTDGDKINIRVPLALLQAGLKLSSFMPAYLDEKNLGGIDLEALRELEGDELMEALEDISVDINDSDGDKVKIFCE